MVPFFVLGCLSAFAAVLAWKSINMYLALAKRLSTVEKLLANSTVDPTKLLDQVTNDQEKAKQDQSQVRLAEIALEKEKLQAEITKAKLRADVEKAKAENNPAALFWK